YGQALAIDMAGEELWRFEPVHNEMQLDLRRARDAEASYYSMAGSIVYGLDENGSMLWVRQIPSATSIQSSRPWMRVDSEGNLQTVSNGGRVRVSRYGMMEQVGGGDIWNIR